MGVIVMRSRHILRRNVVRVLFGAACTFVTPQVLRAHAIHTTMTVLTTTPSGPTPNIRAFADDFSATVARFPGRRAPADSSAPAVDVTRYVNAHFTVYDGAGRVVTLESCGIRRANELYWLCFRAVTPQSGTGVRLRNRMLTELHDDQVNIVQVENRGARRTLLFTKASAAALLGS
ncbi:MAG: hypothetical protein H7305_08905 [Gemmatimonadaceae bacterium]|nr:hypothetical protein [Gemmatimonadaceae bacterium]